jgi:exosortase
MIPSISFKPIHFQMSLVLLFLAGLYYPFFETMVAAWNSNPNYSHGYFIPVIAVFMIYSMREELKRLQVSPSNWGLLLVVLGLMQLVVAKIAAEYFLQRTSMIVVLFGLALFLAGRAFTKKISLPLLYLIFMIPIPAIIWNKFAFPMQLFASTTSEHIIRMLGIPILREGNVLHLANTSLEVVDACSGIRSLTSLLALSGAFAFLCPLSRPRKWALFLSAGPIAIFVNIVRLSFTAILASRYGDETAKGFLHEVSGWVTFLLGLAILIGIYALLANRKSGNVPKA